MYLDIYGLIGWVRALADTADLTVQFYPKGENGCPATDGKVIYVNEPLVDWTKEEVLKWKADIYHEIGHNVPRNRDIFKKLQEEKIDISTFYGRCINILDDFRQEHYKPDEYAEKKRVMVEAREPIMESKKEFITKALKKKPDLYDEQEELGLLEAMWIPDHEHRQSWQTGMTHHADTMRKILPKKFVELGDELSTPEWEEQYLSMETADDVFDMADLIIENVMKKDPKEEKKKAQDSYKAKQKSKSGGKGKKDSSDVRKDLLEKLEKGEPITPEEWMEGADMDIHLDEIEKGKPGAFIPSGSSGHHTGRGRWQPLNPKSFKFYSNKDILKGKVPSSGWGRGRGGITWEVSKLGQQVKRALMAAIQTRHLYGQKKGRLHGKNLFRVGIKDAPGYNERIMKLKEEKLDVNCAVTVLVDCSGSMGGSKFSCAANSAYAFIDALQTIRVPLQVIGFTDTDEMLMYEFKKFDERVNLDQVKTMFEKVGNALYNNTDPDAVLYVYDQLKRRKEKRKLLICLSDGSPASGINHTDVDQGLKDVVKAIHKEGIVEPYGIGMLYDGVKKYFPQSETIKKPEYLEKALLGLITRKIIKQHK